MVLFFFWDVEEEQSFCREDKEEDWLGNLELGSKNDTWERGEGATVTANSSDIQLSETKNFNERFYMY
jgi:hypothetical protein